MLRAMPVKVAVKMNVSGTDHVNLIDSRTGDNNGTDIGRGNNNGACNDNGITMAFTMALTITLCQWQSHKQWQ